jgi:hypothetical protein
MGFVYPTSRRWVVWRVCRRCYAQARMMEHAGGSPLQPSTAPFTQSSMLPTVAWHEGSTARKLSRHAEGLGAEPTLPPSLHSIRVAQPPTRPATHSQSSMASASDRLTIVTSRSAPEEGPGSDNPSSSSDSSLHATEQKANKNGASPNTFPSLVIVRYHVMQRLEADRRPADRPSGAFVHGGAGRFGAPGGIPRRSDCRTAAARLNACRSPRRSTE